MSDQDLVLVSRDGAIATITFNRPNARNAIDDAMRAALKRAVEELSGDPATRAIVLTGAGTAFCAGGDVKAMRARLEAPAGTIASAGWSRQRQVAAFVAALHDAPVVTIAAVNGPAMGLGMDIALACDFIVAAPEAKFAASFIKRGLIPDGGSLYFLPRRIGLQRAKELLYSGRTVESDEALRIGLIDRLASPGRLTEETSEFAAQFVGNSASAIALMKSIIGRTFESRLEGIAQLGGQAQAISYTTQEHRDSVEEFLGR